MSFFTEGLMSGRDWRGLERGVARLMGHCGWRGVKIIGQTGDQGADILATGGPRDPRTSYAVQVKSITAGNYVGPSAVDEVLAAMATYGAHKGVVATNGTFRDSAHARVKILEAQGWSLKLWNGAFVETLFSQMPADPALKRQPRGYQSPIIQKAIASIESGAKRLNFVLATGLGKSLVAAEIIRRLWQERGFRRILVLCHIKGSCGPARSFILEPA